MKPWFFTIFMVITSFQVISNTALGSITLPEGDRFYQKITGEVGEEDRDRWNRIFAAKQYFYGREPEDFLKEQVDTLPLGRALDIAMSEGRNAVFLAKKGFRVDGVDISEVALRKARRLARESHVSINTVNADLDAYSITPEHYNLIVNVKYFQKSLIPKIKRGLKKGGRVLFVNFTVEQLQNPGGQGIPRNFLLEKGELKSLFQDFKIIHYEENNDGKQALAKLVAEKL